VRDPKGIDAELLKKVKEVRRGRISQYAERQRHAVFVADRSVWEVPCQVGVSTREIVVDIHRRCHDTAMKDGKPGNYLVGANRMGYA
jgi:hypothetical protein